MRLRKLLILCLGASLPVLSACSIAKGYSDSEREMVNTMTPSKYQPATRDMRTTIETQDILSQAAFWSREYQLNPADLEAAVKLASAVRRMGNPSKAAEITQTTRAMYPDDPYLIAEHSAAMIALEKGQEALRPLDKALHSAPGYARLWSLKGAALDQIGKYTEARNHYNRALQITPNDPNVLANMGLSFALAGDPATAEQWLRRAASHPDAGTGINQNLDLVLQLQGKPVRSASTQPTSRTSAQPSSQTYSGSASPMAPRQQTAPQARGVYTPRSQTLANPAHMGHRAPQVATPPQRHPSQMQSQFRPSPQVQQRQGQPQIQPQVQQQGDILEMIARSNQKRVQTQPFGQAVPQSGAAIAGRQPIPQYNGYPQGQPMSQPQAAPAQQPYMSYEGVQSRRGAARRR